MGVRVVAGLFAVVGLIAIGFILLGSFNLHPTSGPACFPVLHTPDAETAYEPGHQDSLLCTQGRLGRLAGAVLVAIPTSILGAAALLYRERDPGS
ncbi:hypothetical protein [Microlunatus sp. GCM10028923]|uniref:hypothetical protein n=1 Tax=Microlunatus sp. GCM10028923 TaxID=3273400 RepID=UPI003613F4EB